MENRTGFVELVARQSIISLLVVLCIVLAVTVAAGSEAKSAAVSSAAVPFGRVFQVNGADTWADAVLPTSDGYLVVDDYATGGDFALNLTEFDGVGRPIRSRNLSVIPSLADSVRPTQDGGVLIAAYTDSTSPRRGMLIKLDSDLEIAWARAFHGDGAVSVEGVAETADGGIVTSVSDDGRISIAKLDSDGDMVWKTTILSGGEWALATDIVETTYLDGAGKKQCGGYVVYGAVQQPASDWDLYLAALSCDGQNLLWQRIFGGTSWESHQPLDPGWWFPRSTNLAVLDDRSSLETQEVDLLLATTTDSFGADEALLLAPFTVSGGKTLSNAPVLGPFKLLDATTADRLVGPFGGPNLITQSDGNVLLAGSILHRAPWNIRALLVKLEPDLSLVWQYTYDLEEMLSLYDSPQAIVAAGGGPQGLLLRLAPDGTAEGPCVTRQVSELKVSPVAPKIETPAYTLGATSLEVSDLTVTLSQAQVSLMCPSFGYIPMIVR